MNRYNKLRSLLETRLPVSEVPREGHSDKLGKPWSKAAINARKWALKNPEAAESGLAPSRRATTPRDTRATVVDPKKK
jgi:hypothetical protein